MRTEKRVNKPWANLFAILADFFADGSILTWCHGTFGKDRVGRHRTGFATIRCTWTFDMHSPSGFISLIDPGWPTLPATKVSIKNAFTDASAESFSSLCLLNLHLFVLADDFLQSCPWNPITKDLARNQLRTQRNPSKVQMGHLLTPKMWKSCVFLSSPLFSFVPVTQLLDSHLQMRDCYSYSYRARYGESRN